MTWTIQLTDDGGVSFTDGKIDMVGIKNQVSRNEVEQRTRIRFATQTRSNILHPMEGFDLDMVMNGARIFSGDQTYPVDAIVVNQARATLSQDGDINFRSAEISMTRDDRRAIVRINFHLASSGIEMIEFVGGLEGV